MGRAPPTKKKPKPRVPARAAQKGGSVEGSGGNSDELAGALDAIIGSSAPAAPDDKIVKYAEKAVQKPERRPVARSPPVEKFRPRDQREQLDPVLRGSKDYPQVVKGDTVVSKLEDDLKTMVKSIREVVQKTIGNIESSDKISKVNESLVNFANDSMTIIIKLSDTFYTVISHMKELNKELENLNRQTASNPIAATVGSLDARIRGNMKELRKQFEDSVRKISSYAGPEVSNIVNRAIQSMTDVIERSGELYKVVQQQQQPPQWGRQQYL